MRHTVSPTTNRTARLPLRVTIAALPTCRGRGKSRGRTILAFPPKRDRVAFYAYRKKRPDGFFAAGTGLGYELHRALAVLTGDAARDEQPQHREAHVQPRKNREGGAKSCS